LNGLRERRQVAAAAQRNYIANYTMSLRNCAPYSLVLRWRIDEELMKNVCHRCFGFGGGLC
ncbi:MAG: hypothetical protein ABIO88_03520, partial [Burkholderiaceae bacterium]